jgi:uncharacterized protein YqgC (DUF456 family)
VAGTRVGGGSSRGVIERSWASVGGSRCGLIPIPIVGTLVGAAVGTFAGAAIGELTSADAPRSGALRAALGATVGRLAGTMGKTLLACAAWVLLSLRAFVSGGIGFDRLRRLCPRGGAGFTPMLWGPGQWAGRRWG